MVSLWIFLDLDTETNARQLGIGPWTVRVHPSRAIAALRLDLTFSTTTNIRAGS